MATNLIRKECLKCNKVFQTTKYLLSVGKGKFCNRACSDNYKVGKISPLKGKKDIQLNCLTCSKGFNIIQSKKGTRKFCSIGCSQNSMKGNTLTKGLKWTDSQREKILASIPRGDKHHFFGRDNSKDNNSQWIIDRTLLKRYTGSEERRSPAYKDWREQVCLRDNYRCRIADNNCAGGLEVHHILGWSSHPELRYQLNNGITLCHAHHPRVRAEEKRLSPFFMDLVSVLN